MADTIVYLDDDLPNGGRLFTLRTTSPTSHIRWTSPSLQIEHHPDALSVAILKPGTHQLTATFPANGYSTSVIINVESL